MTLIYYDENDPISLELIEDYFWFKYFLLSFHFDVIDNPYIEELNTSDFFLCDPKTQLQIYDIVQKIVNKHDLSRFIKVMTMLIQYLGIYMKIEIMDEKQQLALIIFYLYNDDKRMFSKIYKKMLLKNFSIE